MRQKTPATAATLDWSWEFSECGKYIIWATEIKKEFKAIWFGARDYFLHCGFQTSYGKITFHYPYNCKRGLKKNIKKSQTIRDVLINHVK